MPLTTYCPGCQTQHTFLDTLYGKKVRCQKCRKFFYAGLPQKGLADEADAPAPEEGIAVALPADISRQQPEYSRSNRDPDDWDGDDRRPAPVLRRREPASGRGLVIGLCITIGLLLIGGLAAFLVLVTTVFNVGQQIGQEFRDKLQRLPQNVPAPPPIEPGPDGPIPLDPNPPNVAPGAVRARVNLIPLIDPRRDAVHGRWAIVNNILRCDDMNFVPRLQIPYQPPAEYDFIVRFSQANLRNGVSLIMPNPRGGSFYWFVGSISRIMMGPKEN